MRGGWPMKRVAHIFGLSGVAVLLTVGCSTTPTPSTPAPAPAPVSAPAPTGGVISVAIPASPLHVGETERFTIRVNGINPVFTLAVDFGDGTSVTLSQVSSAVDLSHVYHAAGTYTVTAVVTTNNGTLNAVVPVRVEP